MTANPLREIPDIFAPSDGDSIPGLAEDELLDDETIRANRAEHQRRVDEYRLHPTDFEPVQRHAG